MIEPKDVFVRIIVQPSGGQVVPGKPPIGEITVWPTDFQVNERDTVHWQLFWVDEVKAPTGQDPFTVTAARSPHSPFVLKFDSADGFGDALVRSEGGEAVAKAKKAGVYHYEVAVAFADGKDRALRVIALLGCPSGTVHPNN